MEPQYLLFVHPVWQVAATLVGLYAAWLGLKRLRSLHLGHSVSFPRSRHALAGKLALGGIILGSLGGAIMVRWLFRRWVILGAHGWLGLVAVALALFGLITGLILERRPAPRKALPLAHGLINLLVLALCLVQFYFGELLLGALAPDD
ncbi:MAG: DUF4079 domain-containing protein [Desulfarculus sp.]|nr:MAG: DUF4079 domain-containing protein [Desulfarculus sp.]